LIFPHLPPEQDVKLAASAGVTDVTGWPELQDIGLAANSQRVSDRLYNLLAAGEVADVRIGVRLDHSAMAAQCPVCPKDGVIGLPACR